MTRYQISKLEPGTVARLDFDGLRDNLELVVALGSTGEGEDKKLLFRSQGVNGRKIEWEAYRFHKQWVYGSSARRLRLAGVVIPA